MTTPHEKNLVFRPEALRSAAREAPTGPASLELDTRAGRLAGWMLVGTFAAAAAAAAFVRVERYASGHGVIAPRPEPGAYVHLTIYLPGEQVRLAQKVLLEVTDGNAWTEATVVALDSASLTGSSLPKGGVPVYALLKDPQRSSQLPSRPEEAAAHLRLKVSVEKVSALSALMSSARELFGKTRS